MKSFSKGLPVLSASRRHFIVGLALMAAWPLTRGQGRGMTAIPANPHAPTLRLNNDDGKAIDLAQYRDKVVLVNFWASWCPPCRKEFPSLSRVRKLFKPSEFEVLAVNVGEEPDFAFSFTGITDFPVLFDRDSKAIDAWGVRGLPTTFLVDRKGHMVYRASGGREFDDPDIVSTIRQLLS